MLLGITGFVIIFVMVFLLLKEKAIPVSVFVFLPLAGAFINGFSVGEIADFVTKGCSTVWPMAALFVFTVTYFDLMADVGLFDQVVEKSVKIANGNVTGVLLAIFVIATVASLAADSPSTYLITMIPPAAPGAEAEYPGDLCYAGNMYGNFRYEFAAMGRRCQSGQHYGGNRFRGDVETLNSRPDFWLVLCADCCIFYRRGREKTWRWKTEQR